MKKDFSPEALLQSLDAATQGSPCPIRRALELMSGKWRPHVLYELCRQPSLRFGELKKSIPHITNTMLTATLRDLERLGVVSRTQFNEIPPHVEYALTDSGKALSPIFYEIAKWSAAYGGSVESDA